jgi:hypothetical protein
VAFCRLEPRDKAGVAELSEDGVEHAEVHAADELGVLRGQEVKGAVVQDDAAVLLDRRLEAALAQLLEDARPSSEPR